MPLKEKIDQDLKAAMLSKNQDQLRALRAIKSMILLAETEKGAGGTITYEREFSLLMKAVKQRKEAADLYRQEGRVDLFTKEEKEIEIIEKYLPKTFSDQDLKEALVKIVSEINASGMKDMGKVMGVATKELAGKADGKKIADMVRSMLS